MVNLPLEAQVTLQFYFQYFANIVSYIFFIAKFQWTKHDFKPQIIIFYDELSMLPLLTLT